MLSPYTINTADSPTRYSHYSRSRTRYWHSSKMHYSSNTAQPPAIPTSHHKIYSQCNIRTCQPTPTMCITMHPSRYHSPLRASRILNSVQLHIFILPTDRIRIISTKKISQKYILSINSTRNMRTQPIIKILANAIYARVNHHPSAIHPSRLHSRASRISNSVHLHFYSSSRSHPKKL